MFSRQTRKQATWWYAAHLFASALLLTAGNPVSSFVCFNLVTLPALRKMAGWAQPSLRRIQVSTGEEGQGGQGRQMPSGQQTGLWSEKVPSEWSCVGAVDVMPVYLVPAGAHHLSSQAGP